jgi:hypothetical protein
MAIRQFGPAILRLNRAPVDVRQRFGVNRGDVAALVLFQELFIRGEQ